MLGIIGGTGLTQLANLEITTRKVVRTPYGEPSGALTFGRISNHDVVFLARHGYGHTIPPHLVNYRANVWALHEQGVTDTVSVATVGGIHPALQPGVIVVPDQIIDCTWGRRSTYYDEVSDKPVNHIDFTEPYSGPLRALCMTAIAQAGHTCVDGGVYAAVQGPRLETAAEIDRLERDGATMVGMTGMPEAVLARELGISYAAIGVVANHAAGRGASEHGIRYQDIDTVLAEAMSRVRSILEHLVTIHGS
ncbi:MAG TPA: S-methyl-5'-thioinosine phosphorylase [Novimethylophilus sp.]|jgi:5'-methylthioadenosine phosphorylase|uniref:S-methyl-5'-thioinosine phosphorylase n=1 Tax=Novimethylophilus sp. TaxID=2137426 RepID=UPI002F4213F7